MAGGSKSPNMQCTELKSGILLGEGKEVRKGREEEREGEGEREMQRERRRERRERSRQSFAF